MPVDADIKRFCKRISAEKDLDSIYVRVRQGLDRRKAAVVASGLAASRDAIGLAVSISEVIADLDGADGRVWVEAIRSSETNPMDSVAIDLAAETDSWNQDRERGAIINALTKTNELLRGHASDAHEAALGALDRSLRLCEERDAAILTAAAASAGMAPNQSMALAESTLKTALPLLLSRRGGNAPAAITDTKAPPASDHGSAPGNDAERLDRAINDMLEITARDNSLVTGARVERLAPLLTLALGAIR